MRYTRTSRLSEEIKKIVSDIVRNDLKDPRIPKLISITHVDTTKDLRFCTIYVSVFDDKININEVLAGLNKAKGYIRREVGKGIKARYIPEPIFKADESIKNGLYMNGLIKKINDSSDEGNSEDV